LKELLDEHGERLTSRGVKIEWGMESLVLIYYLLEKLRNYLMLLPLAPLKNRRKTTAAVIEQIQPDPNYPDDLDGESESSSEDINSDEYYGGLNPELNSYHQQLHGMGGKKDPYKKYNDISSDNPMYLFFD
jgi:hypothetical protein